MIELSKEIMQEVTDYTLKSTESFFPESTKTLGRTILLFSIFLILLFSKIIAVNEGEFLGMKITFDKSKNIIFFVVVLIVLMYFTVQYLFDYFYQIFKWHINNGVGKEKIDKLVSQLISLNKENYENLINALKDNSDEFNNYLIKHKQIQQVDTAISSYIEYCFRKIKRRFIFTKIIELVPVIMVLITLFFAIRFFFYTGTF